MMVQTYTALTVAADEQGICVITIDQPDRPINLITPALIADLGAVINSVQADIEVRGILITSAKPGFLAGADIKELTATLDRPISIAEAYAASQSFSRLLRRIETCGKPVAAAINGLALGGGLELALACHYRVLADETFVGFPEVKLGLLPGAGGTQRLPRLIGIAAAAKILTDGGNLTAGQALKLGIVHELARPAELVGRARAWLSNAPDCVAPWDRKEFQVPGGASLGSPSIAQVFAVGTALITQRTHHNYPAPIEILSAVYEGVALPFDTALRLESKRFARLLAGPVARNLMRTLFVHKGELDKLARRPKDIPHQSLARIGILGAGMMGSGIAYVAALAGVQVVLLDSTIEQAARGKAYAEKILAREVERGRRGAASAAQVLARIEVTDGYAMLAHCQLVIEAVYEDREVKADVTRRALAAVPAHAVFASNTSTLPITSLAAVSRQPAQFIGMHFFSPVERMPLVEIIMGRDTSAETLARALDFVGLLKKTPIVVNDSRGFYATRVFGAYCQEGQAMLAEGIDPAVIENAGRQAGMPVGPLAVSDEVSLELQYRAACQAQADLGPSYEPPVSWQVLRHFVETLRRPGRKGGAGFYDYPAAGDKHLWPGLAHEYPRAKRQPSLEEVKQRLLMIQAVESARCVEEGIVTTAAEADIGSILGIGFPGWTGGTLSFIDTLGAPKFVAQCGKLARRFGKRFRAPRGLEARAANQPHLTYYDTLPLSRGNRTSTSNPPAPSAAPKVIVPP